MNSPDWFDRDIISPASDRERDAIRHAQRMMRIPETGEMDQITRAHIQGLQGLFKLRITGILDLPTATAIERIRNAYS